MAVDLRWEIEGERQLVRRLRGIGRDIGNMKPEFKKSADFLRGFFEGEVFDTEGAALGEKWVGGPNYHRLQRTGRMRRSFRAKAGRKSGMVWNAADYFKYHQSRMSRYRLPRRVMMKLTEQLRNRIVKFFHEGLYRRVNKLR